MKIGVPTEVKENEFRVGMVPGGVRELTAQGHEVLVQTGAGAGIDCADEIYEQAGARILPDADAVFEAAELIVKVKEPQAEEIGRLRPHHTLFTYLHLAADRAQAEGLLASGCTAIAYETVTAPDGSLPLLKPMSQVAGRMSIQVGARCLEEIQGGRGVLLGGVPGVEPAKVVILGGGVAGYHAAEMAVGLRAHVVVLDRSVPRLQELDRLFEGRVHLIFATQEAIEEHVLEADLVVGAVLLPGASAPRLVTREHVGRMRPGAAIVDISIDQGGCIETSRPTSHAHPTYLVDDVVHYCVTNMPGAVPRTSTFALNNASLPFVMAIAKRGTEGALATDPHLAAGLNVRAGELRHAAVAESLGLPLRAA